jgi:hypothetical protein
VDARAARRRLGLPASRAAASRSSSGTEPGIRWVTTSCFAFASFATRLRQLDAFRRDDYDTAYTFASAEIDRLFDRRAFEQMVKTGYPEIATSVRAHVASTRTAPNGTVYLVIRIRGAWKINGVVAQPDPGEAA